MGSGWMDEVRERVTLADALAEAGAVQRGRRWAPCPHCGESRTRGDDRGVVGIDRYGRGHCAACQRPCDAVDAARWAVGGERAEWAQVRAWCAARGWCSAADGWVQSVPVRAPLPPPEPKVYAPADEARAWWDRDLVPVDSDPAAVAWVRERAAREGDGDGDAVIARIVRCDLARVVPIGVWHPKWARCQGYGWGADGLHDGRGQGGDAYTGAPVGWRLVMRAWGADGHLAGLRARSLWVGERHAAHRKEIAPIGGLPGGAVYACSMGRAVLRGTVRRPGDALRGVPWSGAVVIREGGPDWLLTAGSPAAVAEDGAPAVLGIWSGAWVGEGGAALAARLAKAGVSVVVVATDHDEAGERYAAQVGSSLELAGVAWVRGGR